MTPTLFLKAAVVWCIIAVFAVLNGMIRENVFIPYLGEGISLPLSGITLSIIIFAITYFTFNIFGKNKYQAYIYVGILWVTMTLLFEFIFGHYVLKISWVELLQVFNIFEGNLFVLALIVSLISPALVSHLKK